LICIKRTGSVYAYDSVTCPTGLANDISVPR
jgi:hypothetical protein